MADTPVKVGGFTGLNTREPRNAILDSELSAVANFDIGANGELEKRTGFKQIHDGGTLGAASVHVIGFFNTGTYKQFIAVGNGNVFYSTDAIAWTPLPGGPYTNVEYGVQYVDNFYMVRNNSTIIQWSGVAVTIIAGSPSGTFCKVFKDRLFVVNSQAAGLDASRIRFSEPFDFSATGWSPTGYVGVGEGDGDWLVACENVGDTLILFKAGSMWQLYVQGVDTLGWILRSLKQDVGSISKHSIESWEGVLVFVGQWGVYSTNGQDVVRISSPVDPYFFLIAIQLSTLNSVSAIIWKDKYIVTLPSFADAPLWSSWNTMTWNQLSDTLWAGGSTEAVTLVYHLRHKAWTRWDLAISPHRFISVSSSGSLKGVYSGDRASTGKVYKYGDNIHTDLGQPYEASFETKEFDFGKPLEMKRGKWMGLDLAGPGTCVVTSTKNDGSVVEQAVAVTTQSQLKLKGAGYFRTWAVKVAVNSSNPLVVFGLTMYLNQTEYRPVKADRA